MKPRMCCVLSHVQLFATPWTGARQAPLSMGFSRQEYWSGLPSPSPGDPPHPGIEPGSRASSAMPGELSTPSTTWEALLSYICCQKNHTALARKQEYLILKRQSLSKYLKLPKQSGKSLLPQKLAAFIQNTCMCCMCVTAEQKPLPV